PVHRFVPVVAGRRLARRLPDRRTRGPHGRRCAFGLLRPHRGALRHAGRHRGHPVDRVALPERAGHRRARPGRVRHQQHRIGPGGRPGLPALLPAGGPLTPPRLGSLPVGFSLLVAWAVLTPLVWLLRRTPPDPISDGPLTDRSTTAQSTN